MRVLVNVSLDGDDARVRLMVDGTLVRSSSGVGTTVMSLGTVCRGQQVRQWRGLMAIPALAKILM